MMNVFDIATTHRASRDVFARAFIIACNNGVARICNNANEGTNEMSRNKNITQSNETPSIVLKTIHDDIMRDNENSTLTTKQMRVWLRANMRHIHVHNASWIFTQSQYDIVRAQFDAKYRAKIERAQKRATQTNDAPKKRATSSRKRVTQSNDAPQNDAQSNDAPAIDAIA